MASYEYVVSLWPTALNAQEYTERRDAGEDIQLSFEAVDEAVSYALEAQWWPFIIERVKRG